ncbi:hypothetical protein N7456_011533, partial [Penicillium angulare]
MPIGDQARASGGIGERNRSLDSDSERPGDQLEAEKEEAAQRKPRGFWAKLWRHFKRFWVCYGLAGVIFLAIFLPVFFLVILPAIAQKLVDDAKIPIHSASVVRPTPDKITFSLDASLNVPLGLSVTIDAFNLSLFNRQVKPMTPFVIVSLNDTHLKGNSELKISGQTTEVLDEIQFTDFLANAVYSETFTLSAYGKTTAHLGKLKVPLKLDKDVQLKGLDKIEGFSIPSASVALPPKADGSNLLGSAVLPNYSVVTFELGNVTLNLKIGDLLLGNGTIENVLLKPGNNTVPLRATLDIPNAIKNIGQILESESEALSEGDIMVSASGNSTVYDGLHIPYFEKVLNNLTISANIPILKVLFGSIGQIVSSNPGVIQNVTSALQGTDLSTGR